MKTPEPPEVVEVAGAWRSENKSPSLPEVHGSIAVPKSFGFWRKLLAFSGPGYLVAVGYMDPGNWATDLAGGSKYGYSLIWVLLMSNLMALLLQSLSARLGIVRGLDLAQANREAYPKYINYIYWFLAEIAIAATDLAEVLGMAIGFQLLTGLPLLAGVFITILDTFLLLYLQKLGIRKMAVHDADRVIWIICDRESPTGLGDRPHMPWSDIACSPNQSVGLHRTSLRDFRTLQACYRTPGESSPPASSSHSIRHTAKRG